MWGDRAVGSQEEGSENPGEVVSPGGKTSGLRLWRQDLGLGWALGKGDFEGFEKNRLLHPVERLEIVENLRISIKPVRRKTLCFSTEL